ncbi:ABC transporter ATP-binding protein [Sphingosinicella sp. YJ22]|uniref:ABC transporter ATP-binding protein n=1 Tax=Sphingosinicella sp. YJ22 TaxID=1104780 RepID=UPI00140A22A6|nr:ABC transporter ATP-binding protein [Sphingosinicella sp. YJ22]
MATIAEPDGGPATTGGGSVYRTRGLTKVYGSGAGAVHALRGVDLDAREGEMIVLLGPSGSGKSTLLNILGGLDRASGGHAWFHDRDLVGCDDDALTEYRRRSVGFVFQFYNLIASLTARENVSLITEIAEKPLDPAEALALVGLEKRLDHFPSQLSGGEQQRVAIARAIAKQPAVLLCDEPTGALDSQTGRMVLAAIDEVNRRLGTTTFVITHNAVIADMADEVLLFGDGQIVGTRRNAVRKAPAELSW